MPVGKLLKQRGWLLKSHLEWSDLNTIRRDKLKNPFFLMKNTFY